jgi:hypothetical protein
MFAFPTWLAICQTALKERFEVIRCGSKMIMSIDLGVSVKLWTAGRSDIVVAELVPLYHDPRAGVFTVQTQPAAYRDKPVALSCPPAGSGTQDPSAAYTRVANVITRTL